MDSKGIFEALQAKFGDDVVFGFADAAVKGHDPFFFVRPDKLAEVATHLRDAPQLACNYLECVTGVDYPNTPAVTPAAGKDEGTDAYRTPPTEEGDDAKGSIHVVYHVFSYSKRHRVVIKASLPRKAPMVPTVSSVWSAANWQERECFDLLGVQFEGHPNLTRIMMPDDWVGHPLRKDYKEQADYHGIPTTRPNPIELLSITKPPAAKPAAKEGADKKPVAKKDDAKPAADKKPAEKAAKKDDAKATDADDKKPAEKAEKKDDAKATDVDDKKDDADKA